MMSNHDLCAECYKPVRPRQEGLQCDGCFTWQHRTCNTGISQREYREAVKSGQEIDWHCKNCTIGDSTAASNEALNLTGLFPYAMSTVIDEISLPGETGE